VAKTVKVRTSYHAGDADVSCFSYKAGFHGALSAELEDVLRTLRHALQERMYSS
jgi:hypothetical protein